MIPWRFWKFFGVRNWRWRVQSPGRWESGKGRKEESRATLAWVGSTAFYHCSQDFEPSSKKGNHAILHHPRKSPSASLQFCLNLPYFLFWLRTCLGKRLAKLEKGLERFDSGVKLSDLQQAKLSYNQKHVVRNVFFTTFLPETSYFQKLTAEGENQIGFSDATIAQIVPRHWRHLHLESGGWIFNTALLLQLDFRVVISTCVLKHVETLSDSTYYFITLAPDSPPRREEELETKYDAAKRSLGPQTKQTQNQRGCFWFMATSAYWT